MSTSCGWKGKGGTACALETLCVEALYKLTFFTFTLPLPLLRLVSYLPKVAMKTVVILLRHWNV